MNRSLRELLEAASLAPLSGLPFLVTTSRRPGKAVETEAQRISRAVGQPYVPRGEGSLRRLFETAGDAFPDGAEPTGILVVQEKEHIFWIPDGTTFRYHPGMAVHRIKAVDDGRSDPLLRAMRLAPGDTVLDCTAGLCSDALLVSYVTGPEGRVRALEASLPVALVVWHGIHSYEDERLSIVPALRRIELRAAVAAAYLRQLPPSSWDVVYFDPMFHAPVEASTGIAPLRRIADSRPLDAAALALAARVARRAVVVKDRRDGPWFNDPRMSKTVAGRGTVGYAVLEGERLAAVAAGGWVMR